MGDLPDDAVGILDQAVEDPAELTLPWSLEDPGAGLGHLRDGALHLGGAVDVVREGQTGDTIDLDGLAQVPGELLGVEQPEHLARGDLEEDDLPGDVHERFPTEPVPIERPGGVEVVGGQGDEVDLPFHVASVLGAPGCRERSWCPCYTSALTER